MDRILKVISEFFNPPPKFKVGDIIRLDEEFPDSSMELLIVAVGKEDYQYMFNKTRGGKYSTRIRFCDEKYKKVE